MQTEKEYVGFRCNLCLQESFQEKWKGIPEEWLHVLSRLDTHLCPRCVEAICVSLEEREKRKEKQDGPSAREV